MKPTPEIGIEDLYLPVESIVHLLSVYMASCVGAAVVPLPVEIRMCERDMSIAGSLLGNDEEHPPGAMCNVFCRVNPVHTNMTSSCF